MLTRRRIYRGVDITSYFGTKVALLAAVGLGCDHNLLNQTGDRGHGLGAIEQHQHIATAGTGRHASNARDEAELVFELLLEALRAPQPHDPIPGSASYGSMNGLHIGQLSDSSGV
jgi:hypothetical protein